MTHADIQVWCPVMALWVHKHGFVRTIGRGRQARRQSRHADIHVWDPVRTIDVGGVDRYLYT